MAEVKFNGNGSFEVKATVKPADQRKPATDKGNVTIATERIQAIYKGAPVVVQVLVYGKQDELEKANV